MASLSHSIGLVQPCFPGDEGEGIPPRDPSILMLPDGIVQITVSEGHVTMIVTVPASHAGSYAFDASELDGGPVPLLSPSISGSGNVGERLLVERSGLWAFSGDAPVLTTQWTRDGTDIPSASGSSYTVVAADEGHAIGVSETLQDTNGSRAADSARIIARSSGSLDVAFTDHGSVNFGSALTSLTVPGLSLGPDDAQREMFAIVGIMFGPASAIANVESVTIGGVTASQVVASDPLNGPVEIWHAPVPAGATGDVTATTSTGCLSLGAALYRVIGGRVADVSSDVAAGATTVDLSIDATGGSVVIAGAKTANGGLLALSGVTESHNSDIRTNDYFASGLANVDTDELPRPLSISSDLPRNIGGVAVTLVAG